MSVFEGSIERSSRFVLQGVSFRRAFQKETDQGLNLVGSQIRFLHDPSRSEGYVASALSSTLVRFFKKEDDTWDTQVRGLH